MLGKKRLTGQVIYQLIAFLLRNNKTQKKKIFARVMIFACFIVYYKM